MMKSLRLFEIVEYVREHKYCSLAELMEVFGVSIATIHRDVNALVRSGQVRRVHGGISASQPMPSDYYRDRLINNREVKQIIAEAAITEIRDHDIIFFDSSTTVYYLARLLQKSAFSNLTIITNSVLIIQEFPLFPPSYFLIALGGNYDLQLNAFLGQATTRALECLSIDKAFISALGITPEGISSRHEYHAQFLRSVIDRANYRCLLIDSDKFDKSGIFPIAPLSVIDQLISDAPPPGYFYGRTIKFEHTKKNIP